MASTALDVITNALRDIRITASGETPSASETSDCLGILNEMLAEWAITGIDLASVTLASGDTIDVPDNHIQAIRRNLAVRVAPMFGAALTPLDFRLADIGLDALRAYHWSMRDLSDDNPLARSNLSNGWPRA